MSFHIKNDPEIVEKIYNLHTKEGLSYKILGERFDMTRSRVAGIIARHKERLYYIPQLKEKKEKEKADMAARILSLNNEGKTLKEISLIVGMHYQTVRKILLRQKGII